MVLFSQVGREREKPLAGPGSGVHKTGKLGELL
jgi:hypothetical protein